MNTIQDYYDQPTYVQPIFQAKEGLVTSTEIQVPNTGLYLGNSIPEELKPKIAQAIENLYASIEPIKVELDGYEYIFELGKLETTSPTKDTKNKLRVATYQSSLTGNYGNGFETALDSVFNPHDNIYYLASMGMGISSPISKPERSYFAKEGRLLYENDYNKVVPLPVIKAMAIALEKAGADINTLYSDSAGAVYTLAYGATYGAGVVNSVHQNVRTGFREFSVPKLFKGMVWTDSKISKKQSIESQDALRMGKAVLDFTKDHLGSEYLNKNYKPKKSIAMLGCYATGLAKGPNASGRDPLVADNVDFAKANPDASILLTLGNLDPLVAEVDLQKRITNILSSVSAVSENTIQAAIVEGASHSIQTHHPQFLRSLSKVALSI